VNYSDITINDPNPIKRFLQRSRFNDALKLYPLASNDYTVLDFGGGDGELVLRLAELDSTSKFVCYEPADSMLEQAKQKLSGKERISLTNILTSIPPNSIDLIYSLEVFEHLPEKETNEALKSIHNILKPAGSLIIGVPNELYFAALYKGLFRIFRRRGEFDATPTNVFNCVIGKPPATRPVSEISPGQNYHFHHLGFDHRKLKSKFSNFTLQKCIFSPFSILGTWCSPEVYYVLQKG